jgi:CheY-like chemotaxis protein
MPAALSGEKLTACWEEVDMLITPPSLLIADDDIALRDTLCGVFEPRGFRTLAAADGDEALEIVRRESVHLVMTDLHMPRMNGLEVLRRFKQLRLTIPSILLSGDLDETIEKAARQADAVSVLHKPVRVDEVTRVVRQAMWQAYGWTDQES